MDFAVQQFTIHMPGKDGSTRYQHLMQAATSLGKSFEDLYGAPLAVCPDALLYLWVSFQEVNDARANTGMAVLPLSFQELHAWCLLTGVRLEAWEVKALRLLDREYMKACHEAQKNG